jgi:hypothetical protein
MLPVDLIERPRISETTIPHFIDRLDRIEIALTLRPTPHRLHRSPPHAILMLIGKPEDLVTEKLV